MEPEPELEEPGPEFDELESPDPPDEPDDPEEPESPDPGPELPPWSSPP